MKYLIVLLPFFWVGCSLSSNGASNQSSYGSVLPGPNVMAIQMGCGYVNEPCVSVTICQPGTSNCQTINNVLVDTGSYGLRLFSSAVSLSLSQQSVSGRGLAECVGFVDGSKLWGPVVTTDVKLGSETSSSVPMQLVNNSYGNIPSSCSGSTSSPSSAGYNGILGVGILTRDCGANCVSGTTPNMYFGCSGSSCTATTVPLAQQVSNPAALLPAPDNNGVVLVLPAIPAGGAYNVIGSLVFGIGTQTNNTPGSVTTLATDSHSEFSTTYNGTSYSGFIDSGSNALYFPSSLTPCSGSASAFYCPLSLQNLTARQYSATGSPYVDVGFLIGNAVGLINSGNTTYNDLGGTLSNTFDWGLPFFLGRSVYVGFSGTSSTLGNGPYWAY